MNTENIVKIWDLPLRIFHWLLVIAFAIAYITEDDFLSVHIWAGYVISGLLVFRLIWGFTGGHYARFTNFICRPGESMSYFKNALAFKTKRYLGHNPAGAVMILLLLGSLVIATLTGFAVYGADKNAGPLAMIGMENEALWEEVHEFFANLTLLLVFIHIIGVAFESFLHKENLSKAMLTGYKRINDNKKAEK